MAEDLWPRFVVKRKENKIDVTNTQSGNIQMLVSPSGAKIVITLVISLALFDDISFFQ